MILLLFFKFLLYKFKYVLLLLNNKLISKDIYVILCHLILGGQLDPRDI